MDLGGISFGRFDLFLPLLLYLFLLIRFFVAIQWVSEEKVTLFTSDGLIQIGGNLVPRRISSADVRVPSFF